LFDVKGGDAQEGKMKFRATIEAAGVNAAGIHVPDEIVASLGSKRAPVRVTLNGFTYRSSIATVSGRSMVGVSVDVRGKAGVKAGDVLDVEIELDTQPREVEVPPDLAAALDRQPGARPAFDALSYSRKRAIVEPLVAAKTAETRQRRIQKVLDEMR
jgi:hypothetical protein